MINYNTLGEWRAHHRSLGGKIVVVPDIRGLVKHDPQHTGQLYDDFKKLSRSQVQEFVETDVHNNNLICRVLMEDASKIWFLENENINFLPQVVYEPWKTRWRAHPGGGRYDVLCRRNDNPVPGVYIYFNEPDFLLPDHTDLTDMTVEDIAHNLCFDVPSEIDFTYYDAFSPYATERDGEWIPTMQPTKTWQFLRWSEGKYFSAYKKNWRSGALDLWDYLNV